MAMSSLIFVLILQPQRGLLCFVNHLVNPKHSVKVWPQPYYSQTFIPVVGILTSTWNPKTVPCQHFSNFNVSMNQKDGWSVLLTLQHENPFADSDLAGLSQNLRFCISNVKSRRCWRCCLPARTLKVLSSWLRWRNSAHYPRHTG